MMPAALMSPDLAGTARDLIAAETPFAYATVVRTAGATAAKPGAKALISADGALLSGWLGGACARAAAAKAAREAIATGKPRLIAVAPEDELLAKGRERSTDLEGIAFAANGCPSRGSIEIFIEPCLPKPELFVVGGSPVAAALVDLASCFDWGVTALGTGDAPGAFTGSFRAVVIATQGDGDMKALRAVLSCAASHIAFVGSRRKFDTLAKRLREGGVSDSAVAAIEAPAGLDIGAVTPEEIALSILAGLTQARRASARAGRTP